MEIVELNTKEVESVSGGNVLKDLVTGLIKELLKVGKPDPCF